MLDELIDKVFLIPPWTVIGRLALACALGAAIGFERELRRKSAGLRTNMLTALAAAAFALLAQHAVDEMDTEAMSDLLRVDPLRALEAISGAAAMLAAGTVIASRGEVSGMTTGVSLWLSAALGASVGIGFYGLALVATVFAMVILALLSRLEPKD
ncbi:MAG: MgtC/SapB family protein [Sneathiellaceae bacterium]